MDEFTADAFANRDEPIPVINVSGTDAPSTPSSDGDSKRSRLMHALATSKSNDKSQDGRANSQGSGSGHSLQDRLFAKVLQQVIPSDEPLDGSDLSDKRSSKYINRPGFSLPLMTNNFRRFNARIGVVFVFQNQVIRLVTWKVPSHTLSLLAVYTFICMDPYLLSALPLLLALLFLLVPAFLARHPPPPSALTSPTSPTRYSIAGPPIAPARTIKPASEMSKDFFRNMRDLQNCMDDFSNAHDALISTVTPVTNFSNEPLSSTIFLFLFLASCTLFIASHLLPWRLLALVTGWTAIPLGHPKIQTLLSSQSVYTDHVHPASTTAHSWLEDWIARDIVLDSAPETREVEIFELQRRKSSSPTKEEEEEEHTRQFWESWIFSPTPWEPHAPSRIVGERVVGTRFFEDVACPRGWEWEGKKWELDLGSKEWVEERLVGGVEVEIEGERWVYDIEGEGGGEDGGEQQPGRRGEWRRRRWIRNVKRRILGKREADAVAIAVAAGGGSGGGKGPNVNEAM